MDKFEDRIDPATGILLTPSLHGEQCMGSGDHPDYECCCDECDYYLYCFPDWDSYMGQGQILGGHPGAVSAL